MLTDLDGTDTVFNGTAPIIIKTGEYAVIHWDEGTDETREMGDINGNGHRDIYVEDSGLTATDDQVVLIDENGNIVDAVCWANQDDTWSNDNIKDIQVLIDVDVWIIFDSSPEQSDCMNISSIVYSKGCSIGRINEKTDTNSKEDFKIYDSPTQGCSNSFIPPQPNFNIDLYL